MALLAQLLDYLNHLAVCRRGTRRLARRLETLPTTLAGAGAHDAVFVAGKLEPQELLITPLTGSRVVGYRVVIEVTSPYWMNRRVLVDFSRLAPCTFAPREGGDGKGGDAIGLDTSSVQLLVETPCFKGRRAAGSDEDPKAFPEEIAAVLADQAQIRADARDTKRYRWAEYHLHGDEEVWIEGALASPDARRLVGVETRPLWLTTAPRDTLLAALDDPDEGWLRALPQRPLSDRSTT